MNQDERGEFEDEPETPTASGRPTERDPLPVDADSRSLDSVFRALADHRRRWVCHHLARRGEPVGIDELAELVAASTTGTARVALAASEVEKTRAELVGLHLPKLSEAGVVERDRASGAVELAESPAVRACLSAASTVDLA